MFDEISLLGLVLAAYFGLVSGSFASALIYRIPRDIPWIYNAKPSQNNPRLCRSACPSCQTPLQMRDLIPLLSWCLLRGKCRSCSAPISAVYPLAELTCLIGFLAVYILLGFSWSILFIYIMIPFLVALLFIDLEHFILPDELVGLCGLAGLFFLAAEVMQGHEQWQSVTFEHILGGALLYGLMIYGVGRLVSLILKKDALGFGDVKFFAVAGLWLGIEKFSDLLILSGLIGIIFALVWKAFKKGELFPFGPSLIVGFFVLLFFERSLLG